MIQAKGTMEEYRVWSYRKQKRHSASGNITGETLSEMGAVQDKESAAYRLLLIAYIVR